MKVRNRCNLQVRLMKSADKNTSVMRSRSRFFLAGAMVPYFFGSGHLISKTRAYQKPTKIRSMHDVIGRMLPVILDLTKIMCSVDKNKSVTGSKNYVIHIYKNIICFTEKI